MKKFIVLSILTMILSFQYANAQTLYLPNGFMGSIGTSQNDNVGIGLNNPLSKLDINGDLRAVDNFSLFQKNKKYMGLSLFTYDGLQPNGEAILQFMAMGGSDQVLAPTPANKMLGGIVFSGWDGNSQVQAARIHVNTDDTFSPSNYKTKMYFKVGGTSTCCGENRMVIDGTTGNIGIGLDDYSVLTSTSLTGYKLFVGGGIIAEEVLVSLQADWPDYVFEPTYNLPSLTEVESFIITNKRLPNVPSAKEVAEQGINLAEMNRIQMEKIEELTLYTIKQDKQLEALAKENEELKKRLAKIESLLSKSND